MTMTTPEAPLSYAASRLTQADYWRTTRQSGGYAAGSSGSGDDQHAGPLGSLRDSVGEVLDAAGHRDSSGSGNDQDEADDNTQSNSTDPRRTSDADPVKQGVYAYGGRLFHARSGTDPVVSDMGSA